MSGYRTLLCPTDLSPVGDQAVALAYSLVSDGGTVHLLSVNEPPVVASPLGLTPVVTAVPTPEQLEAQEQTATRHMRALAPKEARGIRTQTHVRYEMGASDVILRAAKEVGAEAVVMGTHGRSGIGKLLMGSVATDVLRRAKLPVILIRPVLK